MAAAVAVYALSATVLQRPLAALLLVVCWVAALVLGVRAKRILLSLQGFYFVRLHSADHWSHGFLAAVVVFILFAVTNDPFPNFDAAAFLFAVGNNIFYAAGKFGCATFGCCQPRSRLVNWNFPRYEAIACVVACIVALSLAGKVSAGAGVLAAAGTYAVVRGASIVLRHQGHRVLYLIDPLIAFALAVHAVMLMTLKTSYPLFGA